MYLDEPRARIGDRQNAVSRARQIALKTLVVLGGAVTVASAFVVSLVFVAIGMAFTLTIGGYLWWKTRELRKQIREQMQARPQARPQPGGRIIEGELIPPKQVRRDV